MFNIYYLLKEFFIRFVKIFLLKSYCVNVIRWVGMGVREWVRRCERGKLKRWKKEGGKEGLEGKDIRKVILFGVEEELLIYYKRKMKIILFFMEECWVY